MFHLFYCSCSGMLNRLTKLYFNLFYLCELLVFIFCVTPNRFMLRFRKERISLVLVFQQDFTAGFLKKKQTNANRILGSYDTDLL